MTRLLSSWPAGPWDREPDVLIFEHGDLTCAAIRNPIMGFWCGYVRLPDHHPWRLLPTEFIPVKAHGGVTFCGEMDGRDGIWIGFDCCHAFDATPGLPVTLGDGWVYRDLDYVRTSCMVLAARVCEALS